MLENCLGQTLVLTVLPPLHVSALQERVGLLRTRPGVLSNQRSDDAEAGSRSAPHLPWILEKSSRFVQECSSGWNKERISWRTKTSQRTTGVGLPEPLELNCCVAQMVLLAQVVFDGGNKINR